MKYMSVGSISAKEKDKWRIFENMEGATGCRLPEYVCDVDKVIVGAWKNRSEFALGHRSHGGFKLWLCRRMLLRRQFSTRVIFSGIQPTGVPHVRRLRSLHLPHIDARCAARQLLGCFVQLGQIAKQCPGGRRTLFFRCWLARIDAAAEPPRTRCV